MSDAVQSITKVFSSENIKKQTDELSTSVKGVFAQLTSGNYAAAAIGISAALGILGAIITSVVFVVTETSNSTAVNSTLS